jgi:NADH dehydrogenase (ubiquinone) 1 alpha subcomplex subunit 9
MSLARGAGGRSSFSGLNAAVFGGTGFLGRYVVAMLGREGSSVALPFRGDELRTRDYRVMGDLGQIVPMPFEMRDEDSIRRAMRNTSVVVNMVGKPYDTIHYKLPEVHVDATRRLAEIAREEDVSNFIHVSTNIPALKTSSRWLSSKIEGEKAVREVYPNATVIRPTDMFGAEDRFIMRMASAIVNRPFLTLANAGFSRVQPVLVDDVAKFIVAAARDPDFFAGKTLELGGPEPMTVREIYDFIMSSTRRTATLIPIPGTFAQLAATIEGFRLPLVNPRPTYTVDAAKMELADNVLDMTKTGVLRFEDMDHKPTALASPHGAEFLIRFRKGGDRSSLFFVD